VTIFSLFLRSLLSILLASSHICTLCPRPHPRSPSPLLALALARPRPCSPSPLLALALARPRPRPRPFPPSPLVTAIAFRCRRRLITSTRQRSMPTHRHLHFSRFPPAHSQALENVASLPLPLSLSPGAHPRTRHAGTVLHYKLEPTARGGLLVISLPTPVGQRSCPSLLSSFLHLFLGCVLGCPWQPLICLVDINQETT